MMTISDMADRFLDAYNSRDPAAVSALYSIDGVHGDAATRHSNEGRQSIEKGFGFFLTAIPDAHWTERERIVAGRQLVLVYRLEGHLQGRLGPFVGSGQAICLNGAFVLALSDKGTIASTIDYWNPEEFARQAEAATVSV